MVTKKSPARATAPRADEGEPSKAELQRRMEKARENITETVAEIKETVTDQYESVKETVSETLDWRAQFRKHSVAWSMGALAVGYIVGSGIAASLSDTTKKGRRDDGLLAEIYALGETVSDELSGVAKTILLPALVKKVKDTFGIDLSDKLLAAKSHRRPTHASTKAAKKRSAKKAGSKKVGAKKSSSGKRAAKKGGAQ